MRAVVFAYHNVGVRCLSVLLSHGVDVKLVVTHADNPRENIWFESVERLARLHELPVAIVEDPNDPAFVQQLAQQAPDFLFSFYYRHMLKPAVLAVAKLGGLNMHGSLLPNYRGRAPVNWAVIRGEKQTGATLHYMIERPDAGDIVAQQAVPILPDDTAFDVFGKVTLAAEIVLDGVLPSLLNGSAPRIAQDLRSGSYFGGRKPEDGRIDWNTGAATIHNLVRGVAPPYPGAFSDIAGKHVRILRSALTTATPPRTAVPALFCHAGRCYAECADGNVLRIHCMEVDGRMFTSSNFERAGTTARVPLPL